MSESTAVGIQKNLEGMCFQRRQLGLKNKRKDKKTRQEWPSVVEASTKACELLTCSLYGQNTGATSQFQIYRAGAILKENDATGLFQHFCRALIMSRQPNLATRCGYLDQRAPCSYSARRSQPCPARGAATFFVASTNSLGMSGSSSHLPSKQLPRDRLSSPSE